MRENLERAQKTQKGGPWKVVKALSDVTYRIEDERRKAGERRKRKAVHLNYLESCFTPPADQENPQAPTSKDSARLEPGDVLQPT